MRFFGRILKVKFDVSLLSDQAVATASQATTEDGMLQFDEGDVILVLNNDTQEVGVCTFLTFSASTGGFFPSEPDGSHLDKVSPLGCFSYPALEFHFLCG